MDSSDKKTLNKLMDHLKKLQENISKSERNAKESSGSTTRSSKRDFSAVSSPIAKKKRINAEDKRPKITEWLNKDSSRNNQKVKPLQVIVNKNDTKSKRKFERNPSFEKYGVVMPSFEKILADQKKFDEHKNQVKAFDDFDDKLLDKEPITDCLNDTEKYTGQLLDCKHLTLNQLNEAFTKHLVTLKNIMSGEKYSERHARFHKYDVKYNFTVKDLRCSTSLVVFTQEQKDYLLNLMSNEMDPEDRKTNYFFKVLLPELCLLIFMDTHDMNKQQANRYLDQRPLDI